MKRSEALKELIKEISKIESVKENIPNELYHFHLANKILSKMEKLMLPINKIWIDYNEEVIIEEENRLEGINGEYIQSWEKE